MHVYIESHTCTKLEEYSFASYSVQLRGEAGKRQVSGAEVALQHNLGLGGAAVVTVYTKYQ